MSRFPLSGKTGFFIPASSQHIVCLRAGMPRRGRAVHGVYITVGEFRAGTVFKTLRDHICPDRDTIKTGRMAKALSKLGYPLTPGQTEFLSRFIRIARLGNVVPDQLVERALSSSDTSRTMLHAPMLSRLLTAYDSALSRADSIDFEGMLHRAADYLDQGLYRHGYMLILVDEFQDTSLAGVRLIQSLLAQNDDCKLFVVGDDWQSIYRFAGALPDVLSGFERYLGAAVVNYLTATFRFDQSIADLASQFIQANPAQLKKTVRARAQAGGPSMILARYGSPQHMFALCESCLKNSIVMRNVRDRRTRYAGLGGPDTRPKRFSVYILGRYQNQCPPQLDQWKDNFSELDIEFQTVHAAKGLEADVVIVMGLHAGHYGFPGQVPDDSLMSLVMPAPEAFPHAEERRLFYVAITRCRYRVYLLADMCRPSPFVTELIELAGATEHAVPESGQQFLRLG